MRTYADNLKKQIIGQSKVNIVRLKILFSFMILLVLINISLFSAVDIVYDDFESGSLSGWNLISYGTSANWTSSTTNPYQGTRHAQSQPLYTTEPASAIQRNISTSGYENIIFSYYKRNIGLDAADEFQVEWYNGTGWTLVESTGSSSSNDAAYVSRNYSLPAAAFNNPNFAIKFECTAGATSEYCRIDNVNISGSLMTDITPPIFSNPVENPVNNSGYISGQTYRFNITITETSIDKCWIEFNGVNYTSIPNISNVYMFNRTDLAAGTYFYRWWANDSAGNLNNSRIKYYNISKASQTITPLLNGINNNLIITYPQQTNASYSGVNYTAATIKLNSTQINIGQNYTFAAGSYFLNYSMAGNENYTSYETYLNLTINKATSAIEMYINGTAGNQTGYYGIQTNVSVSLGNSEQTITLYKNGVDDTPNLNVYQILGIGDYNFTAVAGSTQNYSLLAITRYSHILCQENLQNTSWSSWINNGSCMTNDLQQQIKNLTQYDANSCGYANTTIYDYQNIGCDYCAPNRINTSLGDWAYIESCQTDDTRERQRNWTEYDENNCYAITGLLSDLSENITYFENSIENCDYCIPLATNTTWTDWANYGSCLTNDNQQQNKSREQYDSNGCYAITGLPADEFVNETFWDWQNISCNYCSYNVVNSSWSAWENISCLISNFMNQSRFKTEYDANYGICYAITGLSSDLWNSGENITYYEYRQTEICDYCALDLQNTTKGSWYFTEDCQPDDARERQRNWTQYDINDCGEIENQTYFENEDVACDFLTITCEVGGPYQQGALVLFMGNVANSDNAIVGEDVDIGLYKNNELNLSMILQTSEDGGFETSFSNLSSGSYKINSSVSYSGVNETCSKTFEIGSAASLVLDKTASIHNISNNEIFYNISLRILNTGGSDCINLSLNDIDYGFYELGKISPGEIIEISYLMNFTRQNSTNYYLSQSAGIEGIDAYSDFLISANSSSINLTIPPSPYSPGKQAVIIKNIIYSQETSRNVSYNVSVILYNTGDEDLIDAVYTDTDINSTSLVLDIYRGDSQEFSNLVVIDKAASNIEYEFELGTAVAGSLSFYSNRPKINIPGYGGPADLHVYAPDSAAASTSFDSIIEVLNMNLDIGQDFVIDYWITNDDGDINYSSGQKTIYVPALGSSNVTANLVSPAVAGNYKLKAIVSWAGGTAIAFDSFEVVSGQVIAPPTSGGGGGGRGIIIPKNKTETIEANISKGIEEPKAEPEETERREIICNSPYIRYGEECCLDEDNNLICDEDETKRGITGLFLRDNGEIYVNYSLIGLLLLLLLIIFIIYKLIRRLPKLFAKSGKKKDIMRLNDVKGMKVYSLDGIEIGKVADIFLKNNKIDSLKIKLVKKKSKKIKKKGILLDYKHVKNMGNIAIIDERIIDIFDNINL